MFIRIVPQPPLHSEEQKISIISETYIDANLAGHMLERGDWQVLPGLSGRTQRPLISRNTIDNAPCKASRTAATSLLLISITTTNYHSPYQSRYSQELPRP